MKEPAVAARRSSRPVARNLAIAVLVLILVYAVAGFLVLPWWLQRALPDQVRQQLGWQLELADVRANPFALTLEVAGLSAADADGEPVLSLQQLRVNLGFWPLLGGTVAMQEVLLREPYLRLDVLADGGINLARDWQRQHPPTEPAAEPEPTGLPRILLEQAAIEGGELMVRDFSQARPETFRIQPLDLSLQDFATWPRGEDGNYYLLAAAGSQTLEWHGSLSLEPLYSHGRLRLADIRSQTLAHFLSAHIPYELRDGRVTVSTDYEWQMDGGLHLVTRNGEVSVAGLALAVSGAQEAPGLTVADLTLDGIEFDLAGRSLRLGTLSLSQPELQVSRLADGRIDWLAALPASDSTAPAATGTAADAPPFRWSLDGVQVDAGRLDWRDQMPGSEATLALAHLNLSLGGLDDRLEEPVPYQLDADLTDGGRLALRGQFTPRPFNLETSVSGSGIELAAFQPYLSQGANLAIAGGTLAFDGDLDLDAQQSPLTGTFNGTAEVQALRLTLPDGGDRLLAWQTLRLAPIEYNVHPARLEIGRVTLVAPEANLVRDTDGLYNVARVPVAGEADTGGSDRAAADTGDAGATANPALIFRIGELQVENGRVDYTDRTLAPAFTTTLDALNGAVVGLSNIPPQQGQVALTGRVGGVGELTFNGTLGALGSDDHTQLKLRLSDLSLPVLSPYFGRYLGYSVDSGKLDLALDYDLAGTRIDASNQVLMDRLELGSAVASDEALKAPVKLGLALLTDSDGVIDVNLPVSGDLSDPSFQVGQVVMRAFVNLLVKAAASPFSMLGSIVEMTGLTGEDLGQVRFRPGSVALADGEAAKLAALAEALRERPELLLNVRGAVAPEADGLALLRESLAVAGQPVSDTAWAQARDAYLAGARSLPPEALNNLAQARGLAIQRLLTESHGVPAQQVFLRDPSRQAEVGPAGNVIVPFALDAR
ncbi:hypothetical protein BTO32_05100 [Marinobacter lutaoensis]|uniref:AsmA domain-containing protein n=1 Tax=Marinobacter lutaoensis TaxID=135739 RepID=A0A1V2DVK0_9GAMM|nr:hypothetical protein BTO32_05100 [Marinobacter lutaoensis]